MVLQVGRLSQLVLGRDVENLNCRWICHEGSTATDILSSAATGNTGYGAVPEGRLQGRQSGGEVNIVQQIGQFRMYSVYSIRAEFWY